jgi:hypothetical protein
LLIGSLTSWFIIRSFAVEYRYNLFLLGFLNIVAIALTIGATLSLPLFVASTAARLTGRPHSRHSPAVVRLW